MTGIGRFLMEKGAEVAIAALVAFGLLTLLQARQEAAQEQIVAEEWFRVNEIFVPDHEVGSNPLMIYDRDIINGHRGFWVVEAQRQITPGQASFANECSGSGVGNYGEEDVLPEEGVKWEWFFGRPCVIPPGIYRIEMTKDLSVPGYPIKAMRPVYSNTFRVYPPGRLPDPASD
jgi:hypothetical protein